MNVDIYIRERNGKREIRIPWLPEEIEYNSCEAITVTYDIMNKGEVAVPTGSGLASYSWASEFPGKFRTDTAMMRGKWQDPKTYHNILESWLANGTPLTLMVTGYPINKDVILERYQGKATGGFGDMAYEVKFLEDRDIVITSTSSATTTAAKNTKRPAANPITYTIKKGDTLWKIAAMPKHYGKGSQWKKIYNANKTIIENTAKKYRKGRGSDNGHWIYPGTKLTIPK